MSSRERLVRILQPVARAAETDEALAQQRTIRYAFGQDNTLRRAAMPKSTAPFPMTWFDTGGVVAQINLPVMPVPFGEATLESVHAYIFTPPTGQDMLIDIENNEDETLYTLTLPAGQNYAVAAGLGIELETGTWLRMAVTQIGSGTAGSNLSVTAMIYPA